MFTLSPPPRFLAYRDSAAVVASACLQDVFAFKEGLPAPPGLKLLAETGDLSTLGVSCLQLGRVVYP